MPAYNEEGAIHDAVAEVVVQVLDQVENSELVVINDGSRDNTGTLLDQLAEKDPRIRVVHKKNGGHGPALFSGMRNASGEWLFLIDADRQIPVEHFSDLWQAAQNGHDAAFGRRVTRQDAPIRLVLTRFIRGSLRLLFGVSRYDANVPFKLLRRAVWHDSQDLIPEETLAPSLFLAVYMDLKKLRIATVDVSHRDRVTGEVSIKRWKLFKFCWQAFKQLRVFRRKVRRATS